MKPCSSICMYLQSLRCRFWIIISKHQSRTTDADLPHLIICKFILRIRLKNADHIIKQRNTHIPVAHRMWSHRKSHIGTCLAVSVAGCKAYITIVVFQELLRSQHLIIVVGFRACTCRRQMGHIIIIRNTSITHNSLNKHRDQRPGIRTVTHHFKINVLHRTIRIQHQKLIG